MGDSQNLKNEGFGGDIVEWIEGYWLWLKARLQQSWFMVHNSWKYSASSEDSNMLADCQMRWNIGSCMFSWHGYVIPPVVGLSAVLSTQKAETSQTLHC